jgi:hypothetical protein
VAVCQGPYQANQTKHHNTPNNLQHYNLKHVFFLGSCPPAVQIFGVLMVNKFLSLRLGSLGLHILIRRAGRAR